jgi:hypothetical protein
MMILAVLNVDKEKLTETGHSFENEMGWLAQSGITLNHYAKANKCDLYEYAAFAWDTEKEEYVQIGRTVATMPLCQNRLHERINKGLLASCIDSGNIVFKKRLVSECYSDWEVFE